MRAPLHCRLLLDVRVPGPLRHTASRAGTHGALLVGCSGPAARIAKADLHPYFIFARYFWQMIDKINKRGKSASECIGGSAPIGGRGGVRLPFPLPLGCSLKDEGAREAHGKGGSLGSSVGRQRHPAFPPSPLACARLQKKITSPDICPQKNTDNTLLLLFSPSSRPRFSSSSRDLGCAH